jgi:hypothetical protein
MPFTRSVTRRGILRAAGGAAAAASAGAGTLAAVRASGESDAFGGLEPIREYADWRRTWDIIVPLSSVTSYPRVFMLYDRAGGTIAVMSVDQYGNTMERKLYTDARRTWDIIVPSNFCRTPETMGVLFYDRAAGYGSLQSVDQYGNLRELRSYTNWRRSWTHIVPFANNDILLYDRAAGYASFQIADRTGGMRETRAYNSFSTTWDLITPGNWNFGAQGRQDLLFYDRTNGAGAFYAVDTAANLTSIRTFYDWGKSWSMMSGETLAFTKGSGLRIPADLMMFDYRGGRSVYFDVYADGYMGLVYDDRYESAEGWTHATPIGPDLLLFYNRPTGRALFLRTDFPPPVRPQPVPTVAPYPTATSTRPRPTATATPRPRPTLVPQVITEKTRVSMTPGKGSSWYIFKARTSDPRPNATIVSVTNLSEKRISLYHWGNRGDRRGPIYVKTGQTITDFDGMSVGGEWQADVEGSQSAAPKKVVIEVSYSY